MTGVGKGPWPTDKKVGGVQEKDTREKVYRTIGTSWCQMKTIDVQRQILSDEQQQEIQNAKQAKLGAEVAQKLEADAAKAAAEAKPQNQVTTTADVIVPNETRESKQERRWKRKWTYSNSDQYPRGLAVAVAAVLAEFREQLHEESDDSRRQAQFALRDPVKGLLDLDGGPAAAAFRRRGGAI
jgi:hypothetical protein